MSSSVSDRVPTTRKECLDTYMAEIRAAEASGDFSRYEQLAAEYTRCLAQVDSSPAGWGEWNQWAGPQGAQARRAPVAPRSQLAQHGSSGRAAADREAALQRALDNARRSGDTNAVRNLNAAYQQTMNAR